MSETNHTRSHEAIARSTEPTREELIAWLRAEYGSRAKSWKGSDLGVEYGRIVAAADLLEADQKELDALDAEVESQGAVILAKDAEIARLRELPKVSMTADKIYKTQRARISELEALVLRMVSWNDRKNRSSVEALVARDAIIADMIAALPLLEGATKP